MGKKRQCKVLCEVIYQAKEKVRGNQRRKCLVDPMTFHGSVLEAFYVTKLSHQSGKSSTLGFTLICRIYRVFRGKIEQLRLISLYLEAL